MVNQASSWRQKIRQAFDAFAFEHGGEMMSVSRKYQTLADTQHSAVMNQPIPSSVAISPRKKLLVAFNEIIHSDLLDYAINSAKRFNADIHFLSRLTHDEVHDKVSEELTKHPVGWTVSNSEKDCVLDDVTSYALKQSDLLFVVTSHEDTLSKRYINEHPAELDAQAPWVVIREQQRAA